MCTELGIVTCNQGAFMGRDAKSAAKSDDGEKTMCALRGLNPYTSEKTVPDGQQPTLALQVNHPIPFFNKNLDKQNHYCCTKSNFAAADGRRALRPQRCGPFGWRRRAVHDFVG